MWVLVDIIDSTGRNTVINGMCVLLFDVTTEVHVIWVLILLVDFDLVCLCVWWMWMKRFCSLGGYILTVKAQGGHLMISGGTCAIVGCVWCCWLWWCVVICDIYQYSQQLSLPLFYLSMFIVFTMIAIFAGIFREKWWLSMYVYEYMFVFSQSTITNRGICWCVIG